MKDWDKGELVVKQCGMVDEALPYTCRALALITGRNGRRLKFEVEGRVHSIISATYQESFSSKDRRGGGERKCPNHYPGKDTLIFQLPI